mmetsp:Transcript_11953/g.19292  ORF Transcript_11953/g.19292 Transcript_11953/m.19292 type:complete len:257 (+) Transcript_11953:1891-2661(+)
MAHHSLVGILANERILTGVHAPNHWKWCSVKRLVLGNVEHGTRNRLQTGGNPVEVPEVRFTNMHTESLKISINAVLLALLQGHLRRPRAHDLGIGVLAWKRILACVHVPGNRQWKALPVEGLRLWNKELSTIDRMKVGRNQMIVPEVCTTIPYTKSLEITSNAVMLACLQVHGVRYLFLSSGDQKLHLALSQLAQDLFHCPLLPRVVQVQAVFTFQTLNQRAHPGMAVGVQFAQGSVSIRVRKEIRLGAFLQVQAL